MHAASPLDYRELARRRLPHFLFEYLDGGALSETTLRKNADQLAGIELRQRVLRDVSSIDLGIDSFGQHLALPLVLGPVGIAGLYARRGEIQAARAARNKGVPFTLSTASVCSLDEVTQGLGQAPWLQLYVIRDRGYMRDMLAKAKTLGCPALVFTVDLGVTGTRYRDIRSGLATSKADGLLGSLRLYGQVLRRPRWAWEVGLHGRPHHLGNVAPYLEGSTSMGDFFAWMVRNLDSSTCWEDLRFIRENWDGPLIIKGVLEPEDAREAVRLGADALLVSNHGGRQLDGAPASVRALPEIVDAVGNDLEVWVDSGVRTGLDVVKMLALGARGVFLGRAWAYALAGAGQQGVEHLLELIADEMKVTMALTAVTRIDEINRDLIRRIAD